MNIVYKRPGDLIPYGNNAKTHPDAQLANITVSLERYGWRVPVLIDRRGVIIAGHGRVEAALRSPVMRDKPVPCIVADDLTDAQAAEFRIRLCVDANQGQLQFMPIAGRDEDAQDDGRGDGGKRAAAGTWRADVL